MSAKSDKLDVDVLDIDIDIDIDVDVEIKDVYTPNSLFRKFIASIRDFIQHEIYTEDNWYNKRVVEIILNLLNKLETEYRVDNDQIALHIVQQIANIVFAFLLNCIGEYDSFRRIRGYYRSQNFGIFSLKLARQIRQRFDTDIAINELVITAEEFELFRSQIDGEQDVIVVVKVSDIQVSPIEQIISDISVTLSTKNTINRIYAIPIGKLYIIIDIQKINEQQEVIRRFTLTSNVPIQDTLIQMFLAGLTINLESVEVNEEHDGRSKKVLTASESESLFDGVISELRRAIAENNDQTNRTNYRIREWLIMASSDESEQRLQNLEIDYTRYIEGLLGRDLYNGRNFIQGFTRSGVSANETAIRIAVATIQTEKRPGDQKVKVYTDPYFYYENNPQRQEQQDIEIVQDPIEADVILISSEETIPTEELDYIKYIQDIVIRFIKKCLDNPNSQFCIIFDNTLTPDIHILVSIILQHFGEIPQNCIIITTLSMTKHSLGQRTHFYGYYGVYCSSFKTIQTIESLNRGNIQARSLASPTNTTIRTFPFIGHQRSTIAMGRKRNKEGIKQQIPQEIIEGYKKYGFTFSYHSWYFFIYPTKNEVEFPKPRLQISEAIDIATKTGKYKAIKSGDSFGLDYTMVCGITSYNSYAIRISPGYVTRMEEIIQFLRDVLEIMEKGNMES